MYTVGVVIIVASLCGSTYGDCTTSVISPGGGIANGVEINELVEIECQCGTWYYNGSEIGSSMESIPYVTNILENTTVVIPKFSPQYAGSYTCASEENPDRSTVIELNIPNYLFGPPTNMFSEGVTDDNSITVSWNNAVTSSSYLSHYTVTLVSTWPVIFNKPATLSDTQIHEVANNDQGDHLYTHTFHAIEPYSRNCLKVEAVYSYDGTVLASKTAPTQCFNSSSSAPTEPNNLRLTQLGQTFITVSWNSPLFPRGPITYYILYVNNDQAVTIPVNGFQSPYSFMLSQLEANTTYDLSMSAVTDSIKEGPKSNAITVTTLASDSITLSIAVVYETLQDCHIIMKNKHSYEKTLKAIHNKTLKDIKQHCSCAITIGLDHDTWLRCLSGNDKLIVFETKAYASNDTITLLEQSIQDLHNTSDIIILNGNTLKLTNDVCSERTESNTTCVDMLFPPTDDTTSNHHHKRDSTGTVVGVTIAVLVVIILAITAAVILMLIYYRKRHSYDLTDKSAESQVTVVSVAYNQRSRISWSLSGILNTWRLSANQTALRGVHRKSNTEESLRNDYSSPLPLADNKDATLRDGEITESKAITGILQCVSEEQPTIYDPEGDGELDEKKRALENDVKPEIKNNIGLHLAPKSDNNKPEMESKVNKSDDNKVAQRVKQKNVDIKAIPKFKENVTASYSIPIDYKWNDDKMHKQISPSANSKRLSPIYIEMDNVSYMDDESENSESNLYSVPVDSINDSQKNSQHSKQHMCVSPRSKHVCASPRSKNMCVSPRSKHMCASPRSKHMCASPRSKQPAKIATSLPIMTDKMQSNYKPQGIAGDRSSVHSDDDGNIYSVPIDDISSNAENFDHEVYTSPIDSPLAISFNPSHKQVQAHNPSVTEYSDPVTTLSEKDNHNEAFAAAVANVLSTKKHKHKPDKPSPYKSTKSSTAPHLEDQPLYEEMFQTAATLPYTGVHHNTIPESLNKTKKTSKSQEIFSPVALDEYTVPCTNKMTLQKNPSYGNVCDTTETSDYTYVSTNKLITPSTLEDACTTHTDC